MWKEKKLLIITIGVLVLTVVSLAVFRKPAKQALAPVVPVTLVSAPVVKAPPLPVEAPLLPVKAPFLLVEAPPLPPVVEEMPPVPLAEPAVEMPEDLAKPSFQKGMSYIAWTKEGYANTYSVESMQEMASLGVEWACLVVGWYQEKTDSTEIFPIRDKTPSDKSLAFAIDKLQELNFKVMIKPHIDLIEAKGAWRGDIGSEDPAAWQAWFENYTEFILKYAQMAQDKNVEIFCVGTELSNAALSQPELWKELIGKVRQVYKGKLTYAANWYEEFNQIKFWGELDYAGIDPYFPLVCFSEPDKEKIVELWKDWLDIIRAWQKKIDKPVIFTEIGYKSSADAAEEPWQHYSESKVDLQMQAICYEAVLTAFWEEPWFYGMYWWYWGVNPKMGGEFHRGFSPQNKPAEEIIKAWYNKPVPEKLY